MALTYYLTIDGIVGNSQREGYEHSIEIAGYSFDVTALASAISGGGSGSPKSTFSPLMIDLNLGSGETDLLKDIASGKIIKSIELKGVLHDGSTVYDLKLGDVVVTELLDASGQDRLAFSYQQISLTTWPQTATGELGDPVTVSWNVATNRQDVSIPDPVVPATAPSGGGGQNFYLTIDGIVGNSQREGYEHSIEIAGYSFDVTALASAISGGGSGSPKSTFSPLMIDLNLGSGETDLLKDIASGKIIKSIELKGVLHDGSTVYDLKLGDVVVTELLDASGQDRLAFSYQQISLTTWPQTATGELGDPVTVSWNVATNRQDVSIPDPVVPATAPSGGGGQNFYLTIDGIVGNSQREGYEHSIEIAGYSFDVTALASAISGGGSGSPKSTFSPLMIDLNLGSGETDLLKDIASGKIIKSIELKGVLHDGSTVYDLKLGDVVVTELLDASGQDRLAFSYQQISLTTWPQTATGELGDPVTVSWNVATNRQDVSIPDPVVPATAPSGGGGQNFYLTIDGIVGNSQREGYEHSIEIAGYSFDVTALASAISGGGSGSPKSTFSPLMIDLNLGSGETDLLKDIASGKIIKSIELKGVLHDGSTVYDLKLGDVVVTELLDASGQDRLAFSYQQISLTTWPQTATGELGDPVTVSWNVATNRQDVSIPDPVVPATAPSGGGGQNFYLTIDGIVGNSQREGYEHSIEIAGYSFDVTALASAISGGGSGSSKSTFSPLMIDLNLGSGETDLLKDIASGKIIKSIELKGVLHDGSTVYDLKLGDVVVTELLDASGQDRLAFSYQQISLTTWPQTATGELGDPVTVSWNVATNRQDVSIPDPVVPATAPSGGGGQNFYLTIDGIVGDSQREGYEHSIEIAGYSFDVTALASAISGGGSGSSKSTFSPLMIDLNLGSGETDLLKDIASGKIIKSIELKGVLHDGSTVYDLKLGDVVVTELLDASGQDRLAFSYQQISLTTWPQTATGELGDPVTVSWNVATNSQDVSIPDPLPNHAPIASNDVAIANTGVGGAASGNVLDNDSDPDGDTLLVTPFSGAGTHGNLTLSSDGSFDYTVTSLAGPTGSHLHDLFGYTVSDGRGGLASASLDITLNRGPVAIDDDASASTGIGGTASGNVRANDSDPDGDSLTVTPFSGAGTHGNLALSADGSFSYTVMDLTGASGSHLHDIFTYTESDGHGGTAAANLDITLNRAPDVISDIVGLKAGATSHWKRSRQQL